MVLNSVRAYGSLAVYLIQTRAFPLRAGFMFLSDLRVSRASYVGLQFQQCEIVNVLVIRAVIKSVRYYSLSTVNAYSRCGLVNIITSRDPDHVLDHVIGSLVIMESSYDNYRDFRVSALQPIAHFATVTRNARMYGVLNDNDGAYGRD